MNEFSILDLKNSRIPSIENCQSKIENNRHSHPVKRKIKTFCMEFYL